MVTSGRTIWLNLLTKGMMIGEFYITVSENYYIINDDMMNWIVFCFYVSGEKD